MGATVITIIGAVLASNALFGFIQFAITRKDGKHNTLEKIKDQLKQQEKDILRTQLLLLLLMRPKEHQEIMTIAEHYFAKPPKGLGGDWYMTSMFYKWLLDEAIAQPDWFEHDK